jgi:quercetin dioxygenase-like cupin family protein
MPNLVQGRPYMLSATEGNSWWFLGSLATVKATGAQTRGRLTVVEFVNPPGFAPPPHRHLEEEEAFYVLSGTARVSCDGQDFTAGPGDFVLLPLGLPHGFTVGPDEPWHTLQFTTSAGFDDFVSEAGVPAAERRLPDPMPVDPAALMQAAGRHHYEILGPPPGTGH